MSDHNERRRRLVSQTSGCVVEIGAGTGLTFAHYPQTVRRVVAVESDPERRAAATRAARHARVPIVVVGGLAEELPLADAVADAAVVSLALCSVSDVSGALAELRRVLRPQGELRFLEHVIADRGPLRVFQRLLAPAYSHISDGCHIDRDTVASIERAGFAIEKCDRFMHADGALEPAIPHVIGTARKGARPGGLAAMSQRGRRRRSHFLGEGQGAGQDGARASEADLRACQLRTNR